MERQQLLTKGQIFKHQVLTGLEAANRPAEKVPEPRDHGEYINETSPTELIPKSLILRMYGVLMTHSPKRAALRAAQGFAPSLLALGNLQHHGGILIVADEKELLTSNTSGSASIAKP